MGFFGLFADNSIKVGKKFNVKGRAVFIYKLEKTREPYCMVYSAGEELDFSLELNKYATIVTLPERSNSRYTVRGLLRKELREWFATFCAESVEACYDKLETPCAGNLVLKGPGKKVNGRWEISENCKDATHFLEFKFKVSDEDNCLLDSEEIEYLFIEETMRRVSFTSDD